jgi:hypothetical protein
MVPQIAALRFPVAAVVALLLLPHAAQAAAVPVDPPSVESSPSPVPPLLRESVLALTAPAQAQGESPEAEPGSAPNPPILRTEADLPEPVRETRRKLLEAAKSGDLNQLRALMDAQPERPAVALGDPGDPIEYLKALSTDAEGREMLAILLEVLEAGFVRVEPGTAEELYVWPYFAQVPLESLTPPQLVELFTLLTAADYEDMRSYGSYTFFRVGIAPDGRWLFFLAGS